MRAVRAKKLRKVAYGNRSRRLQVNGPWYLNYRKLSSGQVICIEPFRQYYQMLKGRRVVMYK